MIQFILREQLIELTIDQTVDVTRPIGTFR
jgi:hypothetical protein